MNVHGGISYSDRIQKNKNLQEKHLKIPNDNHSKLASSCSGAVYMCVFFAFLESVICDKREYILKILKILKLRIKLKQIDLNQLD